MSKRFKITIADAYWEKINFDRYGLFYGYIWMGEVRKGGDGWIGSPTLRDSKECNTFAAAKAHVIKSLATPEGKVRK